jgi:hypothetical protein
VTGLSWKDDLEKLPELNVVSFVALPPAGGLLPDHFAICKTAEILPYLQAFDRFARKAGAKVEGLEVAGHSVACVEIKSVLRSLGIGPATEPLAQLPDEAKMALLALDPGISIAFTPLDEDWFLIADSPQAIERYLLRHVKAAKVAQSARWKPLLDKLAAGDASGERTAFALLGGGEGLLVGYNSLVAISALFAPTLEPALSEYGVDPAQLPPAEEFLPYFQPGHLFVRADEDSVVLHGHRVWTNVIPLLVADAVGFAGRLVTLAR